MSFKKTTLILIIIVLIAVLLRIVAVLHTESFWFDEIISLKIAEKGIAASWQYLKWENNPPVHYWYLHYWLGLFGQNEFVARLSSVFLSVINIILLYFLGKNLANKKVGLFAGFIMAISSYQIYLSSDARMYPLLLFFGLSSSIFFWQLLTNPKKYSWPLYFLFTVLTFYTHLTGFFLFFIQNIYFFCHYFFISKEISWRKWLLGQFLILVFFAPWLITFVATHLGRLDATAWYFNVGIEPLFYLQIPLSFLLVVNNKAIVEIIIFILFTSLLLMSLFDRTGARINLSEIKLKLKIKSSVIFVWLLFLTPLFFSLIFEMSVTKYFSLASLGLYLLLGLGFDNLKINFKKEIIFVLLIFVLLMPANINLFNINKHEWQAIAAYIEEQEKPGDLIVVSPYVYKVIFDYYYQGQGELIGFGPNWLGNDALLNAIKYNWYAILTTENMPTINEITANKKRLIVLNPNKMMPIHRTNLLLDELIKAGWQVTLEKNFGGFEQPTVLIFERVACP